MCFTSLPNPKVMIGGFGEVRNTDEKGKEKKEVMGKILTVCQELHPGPDVIIKS